MAENFAAKLAFLSKALSISRGRLAADLNLNKSVVSRWHSGHATPSGENLSRLTRLIADRLPGFTGLDWDRDLDGLAALFGSAKSMPGAMACGDEPRFARVNEVRDMTLRHGSAWEGHWWGYRRTFRDSDVMVRDKLRIRRRGDLLMLDWCHDIMASEGWFMVGDGKAYVLLPHRYADTPAFLMLYTMDGKPVQIMDGLVTTVTTQASREMVAAPFVMVRAANLLPDPADDDRFFEARTPTDWMIDPEALPAAIRQRLTPASRDGNMLRISSDGSLTRLCTPAEARASADAALAAMSP